MQFFYVLIEGVTWNIASKLVESTEKYKNTFNRRSNKWNKNNIFDDLFETILKEYKFKNKITELKIDSTDVMNNNCSKKHTSKSFKLNKQAIRVSIIADQNDVPINVNINKPIIHDSQLGLDLMVNTDINTDKPIFISADKGYIIDKETKYALLKTKGFRLITPKKIYKKRKYKTKKYKSKVKKTRHSIKMKNALKNRIKIEHINAKYHKSYKRLSKINDRKIENYIAFVKIAFSIMIICKT